jgi:tetratricopeptide (TPR) repeat protein
MERERDMILEHIPLEEVRIEDIEFFEPPTGWSHSVPEHEPGLPPVLIEQNRGFILLGNHRTLWNAIIRENTAIRAFVVRSAVHVEIAHKTIGNCAEEALLFSGLLRNGIVGNRSRLAELLGYSRARITQVLNLLKLPSDIRRKILLTDNISEFQLRPLIRIEDEQRQKEMFDRLLAQKLTGRQMALFATKKGSSERAKTDATDKTAADQLTDAQSMGELKRVFSDPVQSPEKATPETGSTPDGVEALSGENGSRGSAFTFSSDLVRQLGTLRGSEWEAMARDLGADDDDIIYLGGISLLRSGLYTEAIEKLETVLHAHPEHAGAYFYLGRCHNLLGDPETAETYIRNAVELEPDDPDYLMELAIVLEKMNRINEASTCYKRAGSIRKSTPVDQESS